MFHINLAFFQTFTSNRKMSCYLVWSLTVGLIKEIYRYNMLDLSKTTKNNNNH